MMIFRERKSFNHRPDDDCPKFHWGGLNSDSSSSSEELFSPCHSYFDTRYVVGTQSPSEDVMKLFPSFHGRYRYVGFNWYLPFELKNHLNFFHERFMTKSSPIMPLPTSWTACWPPQIVVQQRFRQQWPLAPKPKDHSERWSTTTLPILHSHQPTTFLEQSSLLPSQLSKKGIKANNIHVCRNEMEERMCNSRTANTYDLKFGMNVGKMQHHVWNSQHFSGVKIMFYDPIK